MSRIAIIPGDGIWTEVCATAARVLAELEGAELETETFAWGSDHYLRTGRMMPADALETLAEFDAILFGASAPVRSPTTSRCGA